MTSVIESSVNEMSLNSLKTDNMPLKADNLDSLKTSMTHLQQTNQQQQPTQQLSAQEKAQTHPLHQWDLTQMSKFYESCMGKMCEQMTGKWSPTEWTKSTPQPQAETTHSLNPLCWSHKQSVYESFAKFARESGEPMVLMPNFDYGDILNFERFLQALKLDGVNSIGKYKQYLTNKDMRKYEIDLVVVHAKWGVLLVESKEWCDTLDAKRRSRARIQLTLARSCFESMARLICEAKGWSSQEAHLTITECIALPNCLERPAPRQQQQHHQTTVKTTMTTTTDGSVSDQQNSSTSSATTTTTSPTTATPMSARQLSRMTNYLIKSDMESTSEFGKWWTKYIVEPKQTLLAYQMEQKQKEEHQQKEQQSQTTTTTTTPTTKHYENKWDVSCLNWMLGLINCVRNNSVMPVVYPESGTADEQVFTMTVPEGAEKSEEGKTQEDEIKFQPALNVHGEFFTRPHESVRTMSKCLLQSTSDAEKVRHTICLQLLWIMLNDSQKKLSVLCTDMNKQYYERFFARQRKLYTNFHNVRFYTDLNSCTGNTHTHKSTKDAEIWFFDSALPNNGSLSDVLEKCKDLQAYWVFTTSEHLELRSKFTGELNARFVDLDEKMECHKQHENSAEVIMPWLTGKSFKLPLRMQTDLLVIGDIIGSNQLRSLYRYLKANTVVSQANAYNTHNNDHQENNHHQNNNNNNNNSNSNNNNNNNGRNNNRNNNHHNNNNQQQNQQQQQKQHQLQFNAAKKFKTVKFIRGGAIESLRSSLKMHDSLHAQCVLMHVGDEDLFKTRQVEATLERVKEMCSLVREYCPRAFVCMSTLMRRASRTENTNVNEVNKGIAAFCNETRQALNCHYMLNAHFEPDYHTQEGGRLLSNKGVKLYTDNFLFAVDYFLIRNNKQH